jgi:hypothetical protein
MSPYLSIQNHVFVEEVRDNDNTVRNSLVTVELIRQARELAAVAITLPSVWSPSRLRIIVTMWGLLLT